MVATKLKKLLIIFLGGVLALVGPLFLSFNAKAATNPYPAKLGDKTNCTWYAWKMAQERGGVTLPAWGNASTWYEKAKQAGYSVGTVPKANSIGIWTKCPADSPECARYGHVGYISEVLNGGRSVRVYDSLYNDGAFCRNTDDPTYKKCLEKSVSEEGDMACYDAAPKIACQFGITERDEGLYSGDIGKFIYLADAPKTPVGTGSSGSQSSGVQNGNSGQSGSGNRGNAGGSNNSVAQGGSENSGNLGQGNNAQSDFVGSSEDNSEADELKEDDSGEAKETGEKSSMIVEIPENSKEFKKQLSGEDKFWIAFWAIVGSIICIILTVVPVIWVKKNVRKKSPAEKAARKQARKEEKRAKKIARKQVKKAEKASQKQAKK